MKLGRNCKGLFSSLCFLALDTLHYCDLERFLSNSEVGAMDMGSYGGIHHTFALCYRGLASLRESTLLARHDH